MLAPNLQGTFELLTPRGQQNFKATKINLKLGYDKES